MKNNTKTILDELTSGVPSRNRHLFVASRGNYVITAAINLLEAIRNDFGDTVAEEMERRLLNSVRSRDPEKFNRGARRLK